MDDVARDAKDLCHKFKKIFMTSSAQEIKNLQNRLKNLSFDENHTSWDQHLSYVMEKVDEIAAFDEEPTEREKVSKLILSLPKSFEALAMITTINYMGSECMSNAVYAEIERQEDSNLYEAKKGPDGPATKAPNMFHPGRKGSFPRCGNCGRGRRGRFSGGRSRRCSSSGGVCHYCCKSGHLIKFCRNCIQIARRLCRETKSPQTTLFWAISASVPRPTF